MGRECHDVTSHWSYFGRQVTCPHNFCQDCSTINNIKLGVQNITGNVEKANTFNNFFVEIGSKLASDISPTDTDPTEPIQPSGSEFTLKTITTIEPIQTIGKTNQCFHF